MAYTIRTKDGIVIDDVDDGVDPNSQEMKDVVARKRAQRDATVPEPAEPSFMDTFKSNVSDVLAIPGELRKGAKRSLESTGRGVRQLAASVAPGLVDPEAARQAQVAAEAEEEKNPPSFTSGVGKTVADVAPWMAAGAFGIPALAARGATMLPQAMRYAGMVPKWLGATAGGAAGGAAQAPLEPTSGEYDLGDKAKTGAYWGAATGPIGTVAGRLYAPFRNLKGSPAAQESAAVLEAGGLPNQLPSTITDNKYIRALTDALEQIPVIGGTVRKARQENLGWGTGKFTEATGHKIEDLTPRTLDALKDKANARLNEFKIGPDVPTHDLPPHLQAVFDQIAGTPTIASKAGVAKKVGALERQLTPTVDISRPTRPGILNTIEEAAQTTPQVKSGNLLENVAAESGATGYGGKAVPTLPPVTEPVVKNTTRTAKEMIDLRNEASRMANEGGTYLEKKAGRDLQEIIEQAIKDTHGDKGAAFDLALKRYGATKDVTRAAGEAAEHLIEGHIPVSRMVTGSKGHYGMFPERDTYVRAMASNMPDAPAGWQRALLTAVLLGGTPAVGGGVTKAMGGDFSTGAVPLSALSASLVTGLSRKPPTQKQIDAVRRAIMGAAIAKNPFND